MSTGKLVRHALVALVAIGSTALACETVHAAGCASECDLPTKWSQFTQIDFSVTTATPPWSATWRIESNRENNDLRVDVQTIVDGRPVNGSAGLVGGRISISTGLDKKLPPSDAIGISMLDALLTSIILGRALPEGPNTVTGRVAIDLRDQRRGIQYSVPAAEIHIFPGWSAQGFVQSEATGVYAFELTVRGRTDGGFGSEGPKMDQRMVGRLSNLSRPVFADSMKLDGWMTPNDEATIARIRAFIAEQFSPGQPDRTKNFTGLWKEKCDDTHGLHIAHAGADGKYSISFCGPGGCFKPGTYRDDSFITSDKNYKVVSDTEIGVRGRGDQYASYVRCSTESTPPLPSANVKR
ncbi:MAG: hypothetical protein KA260_00425 [Burkholderiales bacterium]|nr:hypothetical protein [Burkholderiales bacterium]